MTDPKIDTVLENNLTGWIKDHRERYLASDGADGHMWDSGLKGGPGLISTLILTTTGRKSGEPRVLPLIYGETDAGNYVIIASRGGDTKHPSWYLNLLANPEVKVQIAADKFTARARIASGEERVALWAQQEKTFPGYAEYQRLAGDREIPVVVLERI